MDWHAEVYSPGAKFEKVRDKSGKSTWPSIRRKVSRRDHQTCQRCRVVLGYRSCSTHHIIPRSEGGGDHLENLITLCTKCHDWVELTDPPLRTRGLISASFEPLIPVYSVGDSPARPSWHSVVYGNGRLSR